VLNAFLLDHVNADFLELERWNRMIDDGSAIYGTDFAERLNTRAREQGRNPRHRIHALAIHPSEDIGRLAGRHLRTHSARFGRLLGRGVAKLLEMGEGADSDLVSYLLFDGQFARELMQMGLEDARRREAELVRFFLDPPPVGAVP
jgi:NTE family protein